MTGVPPPRRAALLASALAATAPEPAFAQEVDAADVELVEDDAKEEGTARQAAPDRRTGRLLLAPLATLSAPLGSFEAEVPQGDTVAIGPDVGATVALGVSRHVLLGVTASVSSLGDADECRGCSASGVRATAGAEFHAVEGLAVEPWASAGAGVRVLSLERLPPLESPRYTGVELRFAVGADYYPTPLFGLGPLLELDLGMYANRDPGTVTGRTSVYGFFGFGLRLAVALGR